MKKSILYSIPHALLYSRLVVAVLIVFLSVTKTSSVIVATLSVYAILSDVFDGIIARKLNISTPQMRQLDTKIDTIFWFSCLFYICFNHGLFLKTHTTKITILVFSEVLIIILGYIKFNTRVSFHTIISKFWAILLLWFFIQLVLFNSSKYSFEIVFWYGLITQFEIALIIFLLKHNQTDVPNLLQSIKLRKGLSIKRNSMFNG